MARDAPAPSPHRSALPARAHPVSRPVRLRAHLRQWATSGFFSVADEFLFAVSQFILNLGLARELSASDYGAFTVAYAALLLFGAAHTALLTEPLMVFGSSKYKGSFRTDLRLLIIGHLGFTGFGGALLAASSVLLPSTAQSLSTALFYIGVCGPVILLPWLLRRACYAGLMAPAAALGGALQCAVVLGGLWALAHSGWLSITSAVVVLMTGASLVASLAMMKALGSSPRELPLPPAAEVVAEHWRYGRWAVGAGVLTWLPTSIYYFLLPHVSTVGAAGALKAVMNIVLPVLHGYTALSMVLLPTLAGAGSLAALRGRLRVAVPLFLLPAIIYCSVVAASHDRLFRWVYAGQYAEVSWLLAYTAPMVVAAGIAAICATALRALQRPDRVFWSYAFASGAALTAGVLLTARYHVFGAILGLTLSYIVTAAVTASTLARTMATHSADPII